MKALGNYFRRFSRNECGSVTVDWVALTAGVLLLGIAVIYAILTEGLAPMVEGMHGAMDTQADHLAEVSVTLGAESPFDMFSINRD